MVLQKLVIAVAVFEIRSFDVQATTLEPVWQITTKPTLLDSPTRTLYGDDLRERFAEGTMSVQPGE